MKFARIVFFVPCVLAMLPVAAAVDPPPQPNIVLILADDLGYADLGCYGQKRIKTPQLDRLAREGMRFTEFYAGSTVCAPSRCVLMTGYHAGHAHVRGNAGKQNPAAQILRPEDVTLAEVLSLAGYRCGLFGKWGLGEADSTGIPTRQGFQEFFGYLNQHHAHNYYPAFLWRGEERVSLENVVPGQGEFGTGVATEKREYSHDEIIRQARRFIQLDLVRDVARPQPFFLYLALTTPHANNEAGKQGMEVPELGEYAATDWPLQQKAHAAMISRMDADIGRLMTLLKEMKIDENTLVLFSSDNGPHAEGGNDPHFNDSNGPLRGIKRDLTEGGIRVPFIAHWPGKIKAGSTNSFVGGFQDVLPTLAALAGSPNKVPKDIDGLSIVPTLLGQPGQQQHDSLYWAFYERGGAQAARMQNWKGVQQPLASPLRLYDLASDLGEERDVAAQHPEVVAKLATAMRRAYVPSEHWKFPDSPPAGAKLKDKAQSN